MTVFLHIGSHKTGTTATQHFAMDNARWLRSRGLLYPSFDLLGAARERSHLRLVNRLMTPDDNPAYAEGMALLTRANEIARAEGLDVLISAESMFRLPDSVARRIIRCYRAAFGDMPFTVVCSLRHRAEFAESLYRDRFRQAADLSQDFPSWLAGRSAIFDYEHLINRFAKPLDAGTLLLPYSQATRDTHVVRFFRALGVDIQQSGKEPLQKNLTLDVVDCLAKAGLVRGPEDVDLSEAFNDFALKHRLATAYGFLDRDHEAELISRYLDQDERLISREPALAAVLGPDVPHLSRAPIDAACRADAEARRAAFLAFQARHPKAAPKPS